MFQLLMKISIGDICCTCNIKSWFMKEKNELFALLHLNWLTYEEKKMNCLPCSYFGLMIFVAHVISNIVYLKLRH